MMVEKKYRTGPCCEPCEGIHARPNLHPMSFSPSSNPCQAQCQCHTQLRELHDPIAFHKQDCQELHQSKTGRRSDLPQLLQTLAVVTLLSSKHSHLLRVHLCSL